MTSSEAAPPSPSRVRPYGLVGLLVSTILILLLTAVLCILVAVLVFAGAAAMFGLQTTTGWVNALRPNADGNDLSLQRAAVAASLVIYAALSGSVLAAARLRGGKYWRDLIAWRAWHPLRGAWPFWLVAAATIAYAFAADALITRYYPPSKDWVTMPKGTLWVALFALLAVVMAPLTEELFFRGWLYTGLRAKIGALAGILVTAVLFAVAHWEKSHLYALAVFPVGLALGYFRERTGSLFASMTFHAVYNGAALATLAFGP